MIKNKNYKLSKVLFLLPSLVIIGLFSIVPLIGAVILSMFSGRGSNLEFAGLENYANLFSDATFLTALGNSLIFVALIIPIMLIFCFFTASKINAIKSEKMQNFITTLLYIPCITSPVAYSLFFKQLAYSDGILSNILQSLSLVPENYNILQSVWGSKIYIAIICLWAWSGYYILLLSAAMKNVDKNIYRAAQIDGASKFTIFKKITLPTIAPVINLINVLAICGTMQLYIEVDLITKGGPSNSTMTLALYLYKKAFTYVAQYGYSSMLGIIIFLICAVITVILIKGKRKNERNI